MRKARMTILDIGMLVETRNARAGAALLLAERVRKRRNDLNPLEEHR